MKILSQRKNPKSPGENCSKGFFTFILLDSYCYGNNKDHTPSLKNIPEVYCNACVLFTIQDRTMMVRSITVPLYPFRKVPDHVILSGGLNNRYWVLDVEERPGLKTLTVSCSKTLDLTEKCLLKDGWYNCITGPAAAV